MREELVFAAEQDEVEYGGERAERLYEEVHKVFFAFNAHSRGVLQRAELAGAEQRAYGINKHVVHSGECVLDIVQDRVRGVVGPQVKVVLQQVAQAVAGRIAVLGGHCDGKINNGFKVLVQILSETGVPQVLYAFVAAVLQSVLGALKRLFGQVVELSAQHFFDLGVQLVAGKIQEVYPVDVEHLGIRLNAGGEQELDHMEVILREVFLEALDQFGDRGFVFVVQEHLKHNAQEHREQVALVLFFKAQLVALEVADVGDVSVGVVADVEVFKDVFFNAVAVIVAGEDVVQLQAVKRFDVFNDVEDTHKIELIDIHVELVEYVSLDILCVKTDDALFDQRIHYVDHTAEHVVYRGGKAVGVDEVQRFGQQFEHFVDRIRKDRIHTGQSRVDDGCEVIHGHAVVGDFGSASLRAVVIGQFHAEGFKHGREAGGVSINAVDHDQVVSAEFGIAACGVIHEQGDILTEEQPVDYAVDRLHDLNHGSSEFGGGVGLLLIEAQALPIGKVNVKELVDHTDQRIVKHVVKLLHEIEDLVQVFALVQGEVVVDDLAER